MTTSPAIEATVDRVLARFDRADGPGLSVGILRDGNVLLRKGYGLADVASGRPNGPSVPMRIASLSKQFLVTVALLLAEEGKLAIDDDVRRHLPDLPDYGPIVTIADLMSNQSGIRDFLEMRLLVGGNFDDISPESDSFRLAAASKELNFAPGSRFAYSNSGFMLLTRIVEAIEKAPLEDILQRRLLGPLGLASTRLARRDEPWLEGRATPYVESKGARHVGRWGVPLDGAGGMISTVDDLLTWARHVGDPQSAHSAIFTAMREQRPYAEGTASIYGLGFTVMPHRGRASYGHHGQLPGVFAEIAWFPELDATIVLIANTSDLNPFELGRSLADACFEEDYEARPAAGHVPPGRYFDAARDLLIEIADDGRRQTLSSVMTTAPIEWHAPGRFRPVWPMLHFDLAIKGDRLVGRDGPDPVSLVRMPAYEAADDDIESALGTYRQADLEADWIVGRGNGGRLTLSLTSHLGSGSYTLHPIAKHVFQATPGVDPVGPYRPVLRFDPANGSISITTDRTTRLRAARLRDEHENS